VPGATIALVGGVLAAAMLALSGLFSWVLSRPELLDQPAVIRALQDLAFAAGGTGHVVFLGLLVAGIAVPGLLAGLLPRWLALVGLVIAAVAELSTLVLLVSGTAILLPIARFTALAWLIATGFLLPRIRTNRAATNA
jgi:Na+-transporting NADH:ubiquinone oxidoreductase subunit NqrB